MLATREWNFSRNGLEVKVQIIAQSKLAKSDKDGECQIFTLNVFIKCNQLSYRC